MQGASVSPEPFPARAVKLACRDIWKLFGPNAVRELARLGGRPTDEALAKASLIPAVREASLSVHEGEIFIIMGLSGSGKSTLLRCLARLIEPTAGAIEFDGMDLLKASEAQMIDLRRHKMGMVFQNFALLPHLSVIENVAFPLAVQGVAKPERLKRAQEMVDLVGLKGREGFYPRELSGGQQQRVGIARSLATKPELWFLDEPFSALDPLIRREMQDELVRLQKVLHKTIVFITHDFDEAIRLADRVAIMKDGAIIQTGTPEELVTRPATDYVAEFTRDVQRAKVVSARGLMRPLQPGISHAGQLAPSDKVSAFAADVIGAGRPFAVRDGAGQILGEVTPGAVLEILTGTDPRRISA